MISTIATPNAPAALGPYSQAITHNGLVYCSGQIPITNEGQLIQGDIKAQTTQVLTNLSNILQDSNSSLSNVIQCRVYLKTMHDFTGMNTIYASFFKQHRPARACVEVSRLPLDVLVEIECIAAQQQ